MRFIKITAVVLPVIFTAQACNFLFGDIFGEEGTGSQGVFVSTDSGETWQEANTVKSAEGETSMASFQVLSVSVERFNTNNLLAASFDGGVFASDNRGESWILLVPDFSAREAFINPSNNQEIFVAGSLTKLASILKSSDRGATWTQIYHQPLGEAAVSALVFQEARPAVLYAGLTSGTLLKSADGGITWEAKRDFRDKIVELLALRDGTVFALTENQGLKRSTDGAVTWEDLPVKGTDREPNQFRDIFVSSANKDTVYLATNIGIIKTSDSGKTWARILLPAAPDVNEVSAIEIHPEDSRKIFAAINSTFYRSDDSGNTWRTVGLPTRQIISHIAIDPSEPNRIYAGLK